MPSLIDKLHRSKESQIELTDTVKVTVRRPAALEMSKFSGIADLATLLELISGYVVGWSGVKETDIYQGGTGKAVPFDSELFFEWISDQPEAWDKLINGFSTICEAHTKQAEDAAKN